MNLSDVRSELTTFLDERMTHRHVPGAVIGIVHEQEELIVARGVTSVEHPLEVDETTLFQIGSRTKTFTATALMRQREAGKLDLDAPLVSYLPEFKLANPDYAGRVTPRHLLTHTGGWLGDYFLAVPLRGRGEDSLARLVDAMERPPCLNAPGEIFSYDNAGFCVAGRLLEVLTDQGYEDAVRSLVFEPLDLSHTTYFPEDVITERTAVGHIVRGGEPAVARPWEINRSEHPAGGIISDVLDQLRYARFHLGDGTTAQGERLLSAETMADMQSVHAAAISARDAVGLAWLLGNVGGLRTVGHTGGTNGQLSSFTLAPERSFAISICTNASSGALLCGDVERWTFDRLLGVREEAPKALRLSSDQLDEYVGAYAFGLLQVERQEDYLVLRREGIPGSKLMKEAPPPIRLGFYDRDCIFDLDEPEATGSRGRFLRDAGGRIQQLHHGGRLTPRFEGGESLKILLATASETTGND
jgi:CubicO group peptidase (beta-lactamase class C family)